MVTIFIENKILMEETNKNPTDPKDLEKDSENSSFSSENTPINNPISDITSTDPDTKNTESKNTAEPITPTTLQRNRLDTTPVLDIAQKIKNELKKVIIGQEELVDLLIVALFTNGHILIEGVPGIAKTLTAKLLSQTLNVDFSRIQFTPDLMPSDVIGTTVYNMKTSDFVFAEGPVFSNMILIDEINRAPAKTQAALFEVMEEHQVTVDGTTYPMSQPFLVMATQNPIEQEGTYKLPEGQLDRFIFKANLQYPHLAEEKQILKRFRNDFKMNVQKEVGPVAEPKDIENCRQIVEKVFIKDELLDYIATIIFTTRYNNDLFLGASPRASLSMMKAAKALAAMSNRDFVTPDDIQKIAYPVLNHRIILTPEREMEGIETKEVIDSIVKSIEVPR